MRDAILKLCVIVCAASAQRETRESRTVQTAQGPVRGYKNDGIYEFYGIPYATAPTGQDRFKAPLPGPVWMQPLEAVDRKIICPQGNFPSVDLAAYTMQEDCLVANVYMPDTEETNLPVLVYVHGGGYQVGLGYLHAQKSLVQSKKIVAVNFNHRLGAHGFLCLGTEGAPGNAGMKDQVALLRWVKKNIANFSGNPDDVTIAGGSAGSTAVDLLMLSKMTEGLYSKVIPESGAGIGPWTIQLDPIQIAKEFARKNNFTEVDDIYGLEEFYTTVPYGMLFEDLSIDSTDISLRFTPCIERNIGVETFLENTPVDILKQGQYAKTPVLYGVTNMEGFMYLASFETLKDRMNVNFSDHLPPDLQFESEEEKTEIAQMVKEIYFGDDSIGENNAVDFVKYYTDIMFAYPHLRSTQLQTEAGSKFLYLYEYNFPSPVLDGEVPEVMKRVQGAPHCAQSSAIYDSSIPAFAPSDSRPEYIKLQETLREMWLNFITSGKPVPDGSSLPAWPPVAANRSPYMSIGEEIRLKGLLLEKRARFWDNIYKRFYKPPIPPMQHPDRSASAQSETRESRIVQTAQGPVRGYKTDGIFEFYGIPYATAPTGKDRFKDPLPGPVWMNPLDAVDKKIVCPQGGFPYVDISTYTMQEDCLIANIYMPDTEETNLPVLVYVHGGSYQVGFGYLFGQRNLAKSKKIVAVNFNYRLGIHGFLCLGTEGAPGNAGMKDQVALLRWVQKNIANFGGNPDDVTIAGGSAGSSAVDLLMLSKAAEGLFNKVIPESGSSLSPFSIQLDPVQIAKDYASMQNFNDVDDIYALEEFYKTVSYDVLLSAISLSSNTSMMFMPCVESNIEGIETFLDDTPANILRQGKYRKLPVLYGFTDMEGYMFLGAFDELKAKMNERFSDFIPNDLQFESEEQKNEVAQRIKEFYFGYQPIDENNVVSFINYYTDTFFAYAHLRSTKLQVEAGSDSIYLYIYTFPSPAPEGDEVPELMKTVPGAPHCAQSAAVHDVVFDLVVPDSSEEYKKLRETLKEIWLNFIITGKPIPEGSNLPSWPPVGANRSPHMDFGKEIKLKGSLLEERTKFWDDIYERFYKSPIAPRHQKFRTEL